MARVRGCDRGFDLGGVDIECPRIDIDVNGRGAHITDGRHGRIKRERNRDHFVAWPNAGREQRQMQRAGSGIDRDAISRAAILRKFLFQRGDLWPAHELAALEYRLLPQRQSRF